MRGRWEESEEWLSSGLHLKGPNKALTYLGMSGPHRRGYAAFLQNALIRSGATQGSTLGWYALPRWGRGVVFFG